ncbi:MAG: hypothetical protein KME04_17750 [Pleurocapsa minor GSE-CHR-MK-17-07R]|jgi:hypothetical protein|nr:hypothetical protein [Pleurocapsa minor GSE-CHR-MK 17-07R]
MSSVVEIVLFRLKAGSDTTEFLQAAQATFDLISSYEGYINRELSVSDDGQWIDVVHWADMPTALRAADQLMSAATGQAFVGFIDPDTMAMHHVQPQLIGSGVRT